MKRVCVLFVALLFCGGCLSEGDKAQWREVWKDARGDNQNMRNNTGAQADFDTPTLKPSH
jgi:hypothetical protein